MPTIWANSDSGLTYPLTVSKSAGATLTMLFSIANVPWTSVNSDTWEFLVLNANGTTAETLTSGAGLTLTASSIAVALNSTTLSAISAGAFSYALKDTTASRTRLSGTFVLTA